MHGRSGCPADDAKARRGRSAVTRRTRWCDNPDTCNAAGQCANDNNEGTGVVCRAADSRAVTWTTTARERVFAPTTRRRRRGRSAVTTTDAVCDARTRATAPVSVRTTTTKGLASCAVRPTARAVTWTTTARESGCLADDAKASEGTQCGDNDGRGVRHPDTCNAAGQCANDNNEGTGVVCRAADSTGCDVDDHCTGTGVCADDAKASEGTQCGDTTDTVCDNPDTCNAAGQCANDNNEGTVDAVSCGRGPVRRAGVLQVGRHVSG